MDAERYPWENLFLSMECLSGPPANSFSNPALLPPQSVPVFDGGLSDPLSLDVLDPQVDAEAYSAGLRPSFHSTILADTAAETPHPEITIAAGDIQDEYLPPTCSSETDTLYQTTISPSITLKSTLRGSQDSWPASVNSNEDQRDNIFAEADPNRNWRQGGISMNAPLDHSPQYTEIHATSDFSVPSALPDDCSPPTVVQYQERASRKILQQSRRRDLRKGCTAASSRSFSKPVKAPPNRREGRHRCGICRLDFKQKSGVTRHHRDVHEVSLCLHCSGFEWHRRHQLREHLEEQHPDVHVPAALAEATRYRRRATMIKSRQQRQQVFPPAIEYYRWGSGQSPTPPLPPVLEVTHVSSPAIAYDPQHEPTMPAIMNVRRRQKRAPPPNSVDVFIWG